MSHKSDTDHSKPERRGMLASVVRRIRPSLSRIREAWYSRILHIDVADFRAIEAEFPVGTVEFAIARFRLLEARLDAQIKESVALRKACEAELAALDAGADSDGGSRGALALLGGGHALVRP